MNEEALAVRKTLDLLSQKLNRDLTREKFISASILIDRMYTSINRMNSSDKASEFENISKFHENPVKYESQSSHLDSRVEVLNDIMQSPSVFLLLRQM